MAFWSFWHWLSRSNASVINFHGNLDGKLICTCTSFVSQVMNGECMSHDMSSVDSSQNTVFSDDLAEQFRSLTNECQNMRQTIMTLQRSIRQLEKAATKEIKSLQRQLSKRRTKVKREPSGFAKPGPISEELAEFLGLSPSDSHEMARTEATSRITAYIKERGLQVPGDGRRINPDEALGKLLKCEAGDDLNFFNMQQKMNVHFQTKSAR